MGADEVNRIRERYADPTGRLDKGQLLRDVQTLLAEVDRRTAMLVVSLRSNVMCRHRLATTAEELAEHLKDCASIDGVIAEHVGQLDIAPMLRQGWALDPVVEYVGGKRIRILHAPCEPAAASAMGEIGMNRLAAVDDTEEAKPDVSGNPWGESHG